MEHQSVAHVCSIDYLQKNDYVLLVCMQNERRPRGFSCCPFLQFEKGEKNTHSMLKFTINKLGAGSQGIEPLRAVPLFFTNDVGEAVKWNDSRESFELKERASICFKGRPKIMQMDAFNRNYICVYLRIFLVLACSYVLLVNRKTERDQLSGKFPIWWWKFLLLFFCKPVCKIIDNVDIHLGRK